MQRKTNFLTVLILSLSFSLVSCSGEVSLTPEINNSNPETDTTENSLTSTEENNSEISEASDQNNAEKYYIDNIWATFLVNPENPAYTEREQGEEILDILSKDSVIGNVASLSYSADSPEDTVIYDTEVITAGGPVEYSSLAYGSLSEVPDSFLNAMVTQMKEDIGENYGEHSSGAGMGYRTFYQASYDVDTGMLQVNQQDGYWARTLGTFSEHCAGVAVDFDISYNNSEFLEGNGTDNKKGGTAANEEFAWLAENAHKYGFIWRYKIDGSDETKNGYQTETIREGWHWRFVGVYHATQFWNICAADTDADGIPDAGYEQNDNYVWEDYFYEYLNENSLYPQNEYKAFTEFYNTDKGSKCTFDEYQKIISE
ncbi:MAG: D-alanyl-D-alanine carboxypeptidase family protein [Oscillospiraceae bacterium]|nr:D-alanyl-D-alanine carboxypeptidase family protein [Oscillospiraceae bacterium]